MKKIKEYILIIIVLALISGTFYWYGYRPSQIKKDCYNFANEKAHSVFQMGAYDDYYKRCLDQKGL